MLIPRLIRTRTFAVSYFLALTLYFVITVVIINSGQEMWVGNIYLHGFPFSYYYAGCWSSGYIWSGLAANAAVGAAASFFVGIAAAGATQRITGPGFAAKREALRKWWEAKHFKWYL